QGTITEVDGYSVYSATNNVFISTAAFAAAVSYTQAGLPPNTAASIMVAGYNQGGSGPLSRSTTHYTLAAVPTSLNITAASFETVGLEWAPNGNSGITTYEISMSPATSPQFSSALDISTPVPFSVNHTSTSTVIAQLSANQMYDFRVSAKNGAGEITAFSNYVTTITVGSVNNFTGKALTNDTINWSWDEALGATYYELYDITLGTAAAALIGSPTDNNLSQTVLSTNKRYQASVGAVKTTTNGPIRGPVAQAAWVYTLTVQPLRGTPNVFTDVSTGSFTVNWITNGNSTWTVYRVAGSLDSAFSAPFTFETTNSSITFASLSPNVRYYARLTPVNGDDIEGTVMDLDSKYTLAKVPASLTVVETFMSGI
ncbi:MAG: fibronectin type III domain-containing protein, partial [Elusimicrobiota bacterium]